MLRKRGVVQGKLIVYVFSDMKIKYYSSQDHKSILSYQFIILGKNQ